MLSCEIYAIICPVSERNTTTEMEQIIDETRMDMAGVEGNLNFVISEVGSEWCNAEDVKRILTEQKSILETLRRELNQKMFFANK